MFAVPALLAEQSSPVSTATTLTSYGDLFSDEKTALVIGGLFLVGALLGYLLRALPAKRALHKVSEALNEQLQQNQVLSERASSLNQQLERQIEEQTKLVTETEELRNQYTELTRKNGMLESASESLGTQLSEAQRAIKEERATLATAQQKLQSLHSEFAALKTEREAQENYFKKQLAQFNENKETWKHEFSTMAQEILEIKGAAFKEQNKESLQTLLSPFKQQMEGFRKRVEEIHHQETRTKSELKTELLGLKELNVKMTKEAHDLATALRGQKKMQGNWGEMILENILERSGLQAGKDYRREVSVQTDQGRQRPDAVVYLPDNKHLIIDAKVSLNAYTDYVNETDEQQRSLALTRHVKAIGERIKELADRNYAKAREFKSPDLVFMFIPIESAFVEALRADEQLFQRALESNILVATPTTLLTSLNIVRQLWRFENQNKHTAELAEKAGKVYDKLGGFLQSMEKLGRTITTTREVYDKAFNQLYSGRGNLIKQASEFKKLGVSVSKEISDKLVEKAELELEHAAEADDSTSPQGLLESPVAAAAEAKAQTSSGG